MPKRSGTLWNCLNCGRAFAKRNQWHSCQARPIDLHFRNRPAQLRKTYDLLIARLRRIGPLRVDAVKSSINLVSKYHFGGVNVRKDYLRLGFLSDRKIEDPRIVRTERLGPSTFGHSVILRGPTDIDTRLMVWLKQAHSLQSH